MGLWFGRGLGMVGAVDDVGGRGAGALVQPGTMLFSRYCAAMLDGSGHGAASVTSAGKRVGQDDLHGHQLYRAAAMMGGGGAGMLAVVRIAVRGGATGCGAGAGMAASITGSGRARARGFGRGDDATDGSIPQSCCRSGPTRGTHSTRPPTSIRAKTQPALSTYSTPSYPAGGSSAGMASCAKAGAAPKANVIATANAARFIGRNRMRTPQGCCAKPDGRTGSSKGHPALHLVPYIRSPASPRPGTI
jgi:hypothetical protein